MNKRECKNSFSSNIFNGPEQYNSNCCDQLFNNKPGLEAAKYNNNSLESRLNRLEALLNKLLNNQKDEFAQSSKDETAQQPMIDPAKVKQKSKQPRPHKTAKKKQSQQSETDGWWNKSERERKKLGYTHEQYLAYRCAKEPSSASYYRKNPQDIYNDVNPRDIDQKLLDMSGVPHDKTDAIINDPNYVPYSVREMAGLNPGLFDEAAIARKDQRMAKKVKQMFGKNKPHLG